MYTQGRNIDDESSALSNRINFLIAAIFIIAGIYLFVLFSKSVVEHKNYIAMAREQYIIERKLPSTRGIIYASDKNSLNGFYPLALNEDRYEILVVPKNIKDKSKTSERLAKILNLDEKELFDQINNDKPYIPPIAKKQPKEIAQKILNENLEGVIISLEQVRSYPEDNLAAKVLGFVDAETKGKYGLEGYYNQELTGVGGEITAEKDIFGRFITIGNQTAPLNGSNLYLTIDHNIQYMVTEYLRKAIDEMQAERGSITIVEPQTGKIIAMTSLPNYNPNIYFETAKEHEDYFSNNVISAAYEPGSIMKPMVMSMAIDKGKVEPDTEDIFGGSVGIQGYTIKNAKDRAFGRETMTKVLENSDNIAMTWVSQKLSDEEMRQYFDDYGFGKPADIDLDGEATGYVLPIDEWRQISHATMAFGQGISVTPLQMIMAYSAIANKGKLMKPYIVDKIVKDNGEAIITKPTEIKQVIKSETAAKISDMLVSVVDNGYDLMAKIPGYKIAGKTGTAQIPDPNGGYYDDSRSNHSFVGFFPADDPRYAMLIFLENPKKFNFASSTTAPYFAKIAQWILNYAEIKPN